MFKIYGMYDWTTVTARRSTFMTPILKAMLFRRHNILFIVDNWIDRDIFGRLLRLLAGLLLQFVVIVEQNIQQTQTHGYFHSIQSQCAVLIHKHAAAAAATVMRFKININTGTPLTDAVGKYGVCLQFENTSKSILNLTILCGPAPALLNEMSAAALDSNVTLM